MIFLHGCLNLSLGFSLNMSFSTRSSFSTNYQTMGSVKSPSRWVWLASHMASVYAGTVGSVSQISVSHSTSVLGLAVVMASIPVGVQSEKETMQCLND